MLTVIAIRCTSKICPALLSNGIDRMAVKMCADQRQTVVNGSLFGQFGKLVITPLQLLEYQL